MEKQGYRCTKVMDGEFTIHPYVSSGRSSAVHRSNLNFVDCDRVDSRVFISGVTSVVRVILILDNSSAVEEVVVSRTLTGL